jgi:hypothetical protein
MHVPQTFFWVFRFSFDLDCACQLRPHAPMRNVHMMRSPGGDHPKAIVINPQPTRTAKIFLRMDAFFRVGREGRAAQPHFVIQIRRDRHFRLIISGGVCWQTHFDRVDLAMHHSQD